MRNLCFLLLFLSACSTLTTEVNTFELTEGSITGPSMIQSGPGTSIEVVNNGEFGHTFVITDPDGRVISTTQILEPGADTTIDVDLDQGSYLVSCRLITQSPDGTINDHFQLGMYKTITAEG
jgi:hypothetical protein